MKKLLLSLTLFSLFFFSNVNRSRATHVLGGEISWECVTNGVHQGKLIFTIKLYRSCFSGAAGLGTTAAITNPLYAQYGGVSWITCVQKSVSDLSPPCYDPLQSRPCGTPYSSSGNRAMEEHVYVSAPVLIYGIPDTAGSDFSWSHCCRPTSLNIGLMAGYYLRATMYPYTDTSSNITLSMGSPAIGPTCYDSSPKFVAQPVPATCVGANTSLPLGCYDYDGDSLSYNWSDPMQTATQPIVWLTGYSTNSQFPSTTHHPSNIPATLNNATGFITFNNKVLNGNGHYVYCVTVSSYRKGQKIAEVTRDMPIVIFACPPSSFINTLPQIELKDASKPNFQTAMDTAIQVGSYIELDLRSIDVDTLPTTNPTNLQSVDIDVEGYAMSETNNNSLDCIYKPCAYLDTVGNLSWNVSQQRFVDSAQVSVKFKWQTDCSMLLNNEPYNGLPRAKEYIFYIHSRDNYCPAPGQSTLKFKITVYDSTTIPQPLYEIDASLGGAVLKWGQYNKPDFQSYNVYRSFQNTGPWALIHSTTNAGSVLFNDQIARTDTFAHYYMLKVNNSLCVETGYEARSIFLEGKLLGALPTLNWNKAQDDPSVTGSYTVFRKYDNGPWTQIATRIYTLNNYQDFDPWQARYNSYRVEIIDSKGLTSKSNVVELERDTPVDPYISISEIVDQKLDNIRFLPNPFNDELLVVDDNNNLLGETIVLYNVLGDRVYEHKVEGPKTQLDLNILKPGVYFAHYKDVQGNVGTRRLVKME